MDPITKQDNVDQTHAQVDIIQKEQGQQPQELMPLRRSTRKRINAISNEFFIFLQENEEDDGLTKNDPINFSQPRKSKLSKMD